MVGSSERYGTQRCWSDKMHLFVAFALSTPAHPTVSRHARKQHCYYCPADRQQMIIVLNFIAQVITLLLLLHTRGPFSANNRILLMKCISNINLYGVRLVVTIIDVITSHPDEDKVEL
jgi:hypothetical protein